MKAYVIDRWREALVRVVHGTVQGKRLNVGYKRGFPSKDWFVNENDAKQEVIRRLLKKKRGLVDRMDRRIDRLRFETEKQMARLTEMMGAVTVMEVGDGLEASERDEMMKSTRPGYNYDTRSN